MIDGDAEVEGRHFGRNAGEQLPITARTRAFQTKGVTHPCPERLDPLSCAIEHPLEGAPFIDVRYGSVDRFGNNRCPIIVLPVRGPSHSATAEIGEQRGIVVVTCTQRGADRASRTSSWAGRMVVPKQPCRSFGHGRRRGMEVDSPPQECIGDPAFLGGGRSQCPPRLQSGRRDRQEHLDTVGPVMIATATANPDFIGEAPMMIAAATGQHRHGDAIQDVGRRRARAAGVHAQRGRRG
ncbi:MAG: hypothetical protein M3R24_18025 [Chloroflexota bacterium]|nr:hypothetical protein [Chloroflexota bacterium]